MGGTPEVRVMREADIPFAIRITDTEHWGYTEADFRRLIHLEPEGCLIAESDGSPVGVLTAATFAIDTDAQVVELDGGGARPRVNEATVAAEHDVGRAELGVDEDVEAAFTAASADTALP